MEVSKLTDRLLQECIVLSQSGRAQLLRKEMFSLRRLGDQDGARSNVASDPWLPNGEAMMCA
jgi:hypothetical protein